MGNRSQRSHPKADGNGELNQADGISELNQADGIGELNQAAKQRQEENQTQPPQVDCRQECTTCK